MIGKFFAKLFILIVFYLFLCGLIYVTSYISLSKNIFINFIGFKAVQKNLYWNKEFGFVDGENCIMYKMYDIDNLIEKIKFYTKN